MLTWRKKNLLHYETVIGSLICFHLKSAVCQFHTVLVFFCHWREGFICLTCLHHSPPLMKIRTGTHSSRNLESGTEAQALGGALHIGLLSMVGSLHCTQPRTTFPGLALPTVVGPFHSDNLFRKCHSSLDYRLMCRRNLLN